MREDMREAMREASLVTEAIGPNPTDVEKTLT